MGTAEMRSKSHTNSPCTASKVCAQTSTLAVVAAVPLAELEQAVFGSCLASLLGFEQLQGIYVLGYGLWILG